MGGSNVTPEEVVKQQERDIQRLVMRKKLDIKTCKQEYKTALTEAKSHQAAGDWNMAQVYETNAKAKQERVQRLLASEKELTDVKDAMSDLVQDMQMQSVVSKGGRAVAKILNRTPQEHRPQRLVHYKELITVARTEGRTIQDILVNPTPPVTTDPISFTVEEDGSEQDSDDALVERFNRLKSEKVNTMLY